MASTGCTLPALVSGCPHARAASAQAKQQLHAMWVDAYSRADVWAVLNAVAADLQTTTTKKKKDGNDKEEEAEGEAMAGANKRQKVVDEEGRRLVDAVLSRFKHNGTELPAEKRKVFFSLSF